VFIQLLRAILNLKREVLGEQREVKKRKPFTIKLRGSHLNRNLRVVHFS